MRDKPFHEDFHSTLVISIGFIFLVLGQRYYPTVVHWLKPVEHRIAVGLLALFALVVFFARVSHLGWLRWAKKKNENAILGEEKDAIFCGRTTQGEKVFIKPKQRAMHTQVVGTTNSGKTESVILPWAIQDIQQGRGLILIDGKADRSLLNKLYAYAVKAGRKKDFKLFSLSNIDESFQFNPLIGGSPEEIAERVFNSFEFDNPYYRSVQFEIFGQILRAFSVAKIVPTFRRLHDAIVDPDRLANSIIGKDGEMEAWLEEFIKMDKNERSKRTSGLTAALSHFAFGATSALFNTESPAIDLERALAKGHIVYFQLPVLLAPFLGKATGKLALQSLQSAVAGRHRMKAKKEPKFYSVYLDDFTEYLYPGFVSVLNKTRSANIGVVFAHQALGDIQTLGEAVANSILTNSNLKIFMRGSDPESAEYFSRVVGTKGTMKFTERARRGVVGRDFTGDVSAREVEEFIVHPNRFKSALGVGEAIVVVPHASGSKCVQMKFQMFGDIKPKRLKKVVKVECLGLARVASKISERKQNATFSNSVPGSRTPADRVCDPK